MTDRYNTIYERWVDEEEARGAYENIGDDNSYLKIGDSEGEGVSGSNEDNTVEGLNLLIWSLMIATRNGKKALGRMSNTIVMTVNANMV